MFQTVLINNMLFILGAFFLGFIAAVPIGPSQLEIAKRSLNGFLLSSVMIGVGTTLSDGIYGALAIYGVAPFLKEPGVIALFRLVNSVILIVLGIWAILSSKPPVKNAASTNAMLNKKGVSFITGFTLALTNPMIMIWWLIGLNFLTGTGLVEKVNSSYTVTFLASGILGIFSYGLLLSYSVYKSKKFFRDETIRKITRILGCVLLCLAAYFAYLAGSYYLNIQ
jgi:threonine/homoserine/homoserine lactone efflux protein